MAEGQKPKKNDSPTVNEDGLVEGVEIELPPLFSKEMLRDTRFLLILACAGIAAVFGIVVWAVGYTNWAFSVFLLTFNVLLVSWFYFLVQHVRQQIEEEEAEREELEKGKNVVQKGQHKKMPDKADDTGA